ncbi:unnamed protein product [Orchesella dallaii]|uniref:Chitin-binding type-2 domain-containing protein n=1 Tax=Orchesella dallaii TaxID=48710 RepID=A0ABP1REI5_9HEXA
MNVPIYLGCLLMSIFAINKIIAEPMIECDPTVIRSQSTKIPDSEFCNKYFECLGGNLTEKYCSTGYHFSDIEDECVEVSSLVTSGNCATATTTSVALNGTLNATPTPTPNLRQSCKIFGVCSQKCNDTGGIVRCSCIEGFKLEEKDNKTCTLIGKWKLLYLTNSVVGYGGGDRKRTHTIKSENSAVFTGVTFDARKNYACWTDASEFAGGVYCSHFNGSKLETIVNSGIGYPQSVALDWVTSNIYFVDWGRKEILVCRSGINTCSVIVTQHVGSPNDLVLEPNQGLMFWTNQIGNHKIMRADMDGRNLITLLSSDLKAIQGLAIDHSTSTLYWIDTKFDKLESCLLDGKDRRVIISGNRLFFDAFFIDVFGDSVFWTNRNTSKIMVKMRIVI